jgi:hypothetical protein
MHCIRNNADNACLFNASSVFEDDYRKIRVNDNGAVTILSILCVFVPWW